jgi:inorganic pyrophosphatase
LEEGWLCDKWVNVKGYEDKKKAEQLLKLLKGEL